MAKHKGKKRDGRLERAWRGRMQRWRSSGSEVREFCRREDVPETSFYHWRRELARRDRSAAGDCTPERGMSARRVRRIARPHGGRSSRKPVNLRFLPVQVKDARGATSVESVVELRLPSGHVLQGADVEKLARLAALVGGSTC
jgi:transposase-like protein